MTTKDFIRYFVMLLLFGVLDFICQRVGIRPELSSTDRLSMAAALVTILWAIRDGQKGGSA